MIVQSNEVVNPTVNKSTPNKVKRKSLESIEEIRKSIPAQYKIDPRIKCPVCKKLFYATPEHVYKNSKGQKVCSWTCCRKSKYGGKKI